MLNSLTTIFVLILIGFIFGKRKIFDSNHIQAFELFLFKVAIPCSLFSATSTYSWDDLIKTNYIYSYLTCFVIVSLIIFFFFRKNDLSEILIKILAAGYVNAAIYTIPIITFLTQDARSAILGNIIQVVIIQPIFVTILCFLQHKEDRTIKRLLTVLTNPLIIMPITGLVMNYLKIEPYSIVEATAKNLGAGGSSMALFTFGLSLSNVKWNTIILSKDLLFVSLIKTIVHPIIALAVGRYMFGLNKYWLSSLVIACAAPTAFIIHIISKQFNIYADQTRLIVAITSLLSLLLLSFIIYLI